MLKKIAKFLRLYLWVYWRIPRGDYCYFGSRAPGNKKYRRCPYWRTIDDWPEQADGYCDYLGYGDMDTNTDENHILTNMKTGEKIPASEMPFGIGLLWDQCKECGIKDEWREVELRWYYRWRRLVGKRNRKGRTMLSRRQIKNAKETAKQLKCDFIFIINGDYSDEMLGRQQEFETPRYVENIDIGRSHAEKYKWDVARVICVSKDVEFECL